MKLKEERVALEVQVAKLFYTPFLIASVLFFSFFVFGKKNKVPLIQRGIVSQPVAIVYKKPDFDAPKIHSVTKNRIVVMSTKIYRPSHLFGSFYRVFINRPRKIRGYISEVDMIPEFKKKGSGYVMNYQYVKKEKSLKEIKNATGIFYKKKRSEK